MDHHTSPFENIENAQEYLALLAEAIRESREGVQTDLQEHLTALPSRQIDALRLTLYNLDRLANHIRISRRVLNDLRTLRRLLHQQSTEQGFRIPTAA